MNRAASKRGVSPKQEFTCGKCGKVLHTVAGAFGTHVKFCGAPKVYDPARFWAKVDKSGGEDACWPYTGYVTPEGYGWAYTGLPRGQQQTHGAHRQAWINTYGAIPQEQLVCHHCDNPRCCNPEHLFLGEHADNMLDMFKKERSPMAKLTHAQVRAIRQEFRKLGPYKRSRTNAAELAQKYGVHPNAITGVAYRRTFKFVP